MRPKQYISVNAAQRIKAYLEAIKGSEQLNKVWLDPDGYGKEVVPSYIRLFDREIERAITINEVLMDPEIKVPFSDDTQFMVAKIISAYKEATK